MTLLAMQPVVLALAVLVGVTLGIWTGRSSYDCGRSTCEQRNNPWHRHL